MSEIASAIAGKGLENGKYRDLDRDHPELDKFKRMIKAGLPQGAIENALMRDGILPSSLYDTPINSPTGAPPPLAIMKIPPPPPLPPAGGAAAKPAVAASGDPNKPPPGLSLIEEMKWRQANSKAKSGNDYTPGGGLKLAERKKSIVQPQRMVALKPSGTIGKTGEVEAPKINAALAPSLKATPKAPLPGVPVTKYTAPVYSSVLRPTPKPTDRKPSVITPSFIKPKADAKSPPSERPPVEIDFMPLPMQQLLPQKPTEHAILDDGTEVKREKDGGYTQKDASGLVIQQFPDGATKQTNPDGTIIEVNADRTRTVQTNPDGTRYEMFNGETTTCFPDGTIIRDLANGEKHQTMPDGTIIHSFPDGKKVQTSTDNAMEITSFPDGSMEQLNKSTGEKLRRNVDGSIQKLS